MPLRRVEEGDVVVPRELAEMGSDEAIALYCRISSGELHTPRETEVDPSRELLASGRIVVDPRGFWRSL